MEWRDYMNKIKKIVLVAILIILSVSSISSFNNNNEIINYYTNSSQAKNSHIIYNHENEIVSNTTTDISVGENIDYYNTNFYLSTFINLDKLSTHNDSFYIQDDHFKVVSFIDKEKNIQICNKFYTDELFGISQKIKDMHLNNDKARTLSAKDYYDKSSTYYNLLSYTDIIVQYNGSWDMINGKVLYIDYRRDDREPEQRWIDFFSKSINSDSPIIIKEAYIFECNGYTVEWVTACNIIDFDYKSIDELHSRYCGVDSTFINNKECDILPNKPYGEDLVLYRNEAVFINGSKEAASFKYKTTKIYNCNLDADTINTTTGLNIAFLPPLENIKFMVPFATYQYDENGNVIKCPIFTYTGIAARWIPYRGSRKLFVGDIDGNGLTEIIVYNNDGNNFTESLSSLTIVDGQIKNLNNFY